MWRAQRCWVRLLPMAGLLFFGPCGITGRQWNDFLMTSALQILVQSLFTIVGASIV